MKRRYRIGESVSNSSCNSRMYPLADRGGRASLRRLHTAQQWKHGKQGRSQHEDRVARVTARNFTQSFPFTRVHNTADSSTISIIRTTLLILHYCFSERCACCSPSHHRSHARRNCNCNCNSNAHHLRWPCVCIDRKLSPPPSNPVSTSCQQQ